MRTALRSFSLGGCSMVICCLLLTLQLSVRGDPGDFDIFIFAQQWPATVCKQQGWKCTSTVLENISNGTTIHGLWPVKWDGSWEDCNEKAEEAGSEASLTEKEQEKQPPLLPTALFTSNLFSVIRDIASLLIEVRPSFDLDRNAEEKEDHQHPPSVISNHGHGYKQQGEPFDPSVLDPIMSDMLQFWPSLTQHQDRYWFWKHEWEKHGSCVSSFPSQADFFQDILELRKGTDLIHSALAKHNIFPDDNVRYRKRDIIRAIRAELGVPAILICGAQRSLQEIRLCISKRKRKLVKCPSKVLGNQRPQCGKNVLIPVLHKTTV